MTPEKLRETYCMSPPRVQLSILAGLAHEMTIVGRSFYLDSPQGQRVPSEVMIALNELQHQITGQQRHLADEDLERYPDDVFISILFDRAATLKLERELLRSFERVVSRLGPSP